VGSNSTNEESERYIRHLYKFLNKIKIFDKAKDLYNKANDATACKQDMMRQLNEIDASITQAMIKYEKSTCSLKDRVLWSPEIEQSNLMVQFWNVLHKSICQQTDVSKRLHTICQHLDNAMKLLICNTQCPVKTALRNALARHKELVKDHFKLRENHLLRKVK
jgi:hypothetical protein